MKTTLNTILFWILAIFITLSAAIYQRTTGPTYPKKVILKTDNGDLNLKLIRSSEGSENCIIDFKIADTAIHAQLEYRRYPTNDEFVKADMIRNGEQITGSLPGQAPAGKIEYKVNFYKNGQLLNNPDEFHTVVRYKGYVPRGILIPHIIAMFFGMLLANFSGIMAIAKRPRAKMYMWLTFILFTIGGMIMGPLVQLYAFGDLWTGIPFGWDLTDNKTLIAFITWIIALVMNRKEVKYQWIIAAAIITFLIFLIPHSMFGSELNYATGSVTQG